MSSCPVLSLPLRRLLNPGGMCGRPGANNLIRSCRRRRPMHGHTDSNGKPSDRASSVNRETPRAQLASLMNPTPRPRAAATSALRSVGWRIFRDSSEILGQFPDRRVHSSSPAFCECVKGASERARRRQAGAFVLWRVSQSLYGIDPQ